MLLWYRCYGVHAHAASTVLGTLTNYAETAEFMAQFQAELHQPDIARRRSACMDSAHTQNPKPRTEACMVMKAAPH